MELNNVSFNYPNIPLEVLQDLNFCIEDGEKVCFIGKNASGKASLLNIVSTLYAPSHGLIKFNEYHAADLNLDRIRTFIGSYLESEELFEGSLYENISLNRKDVTVEDVLWAIDKLKLNSYLNDANIGIHSTLEPRGKSLSRSVSQKILLARAIVNKPKLLIIGNNFNNLSSKDRHDIIDFLWDKSQAWTLICSSNDAYVAAKCNRVFVMDKGKVVQEGKMKDLNANGELNSILDA